MLPVITAMRLRQRVCVGALYHAPTINDSHTSDGTGTGSFTSTITGLSQGTTYYARAYATNSMGTSYGDQVSFSTTAIIPTVTTITVSSITGTTATGGGNVTSDGGTSVTARGSMLEYIPQSYYFRFSYERWNRYGYVYKQHHGT